MSLRSVPMGTICSFYVAPEVASEGILTPKADCFALGILLW